MRLRGAFLLGAVLASCGVLAQDSTTPSSIPSSTPSATTPSSTPSSTPPSSTSPSAAGDTTVFKTTTVSGGDGHAVTKDTTVTTTVSTTVLVTSTLFSTKVVTSSDQDTATQTIYVTSTHVVSKRAIDLVPRTDTPAAADAVPTAAAVVNKDSNDLRKRATITDFITVTAGSGSTTVFKTITSTIVSTKSSVTTIVSTITSTDQVNAKTTITTTSTLVVTSTQGGSETTTTSSSDTGSSSSSSSGLSTGAKIGIGVGVGVGALLVLGALAFFCFRRRRRSPKPYHDDLIGASEVPVGGPVGSTPSPMSHTTSPGAGFVGSGRSSRTPVQTKFSPEGYRGTAMGDGRAGYAKPEPYGAAYAQAPTSRGGTADALPEHAHPAEMDSATRAEMDSQPAPPSREAPPNVYEMPAQNF